MQVAELMTRHVEFIEPDASVRAAATLMGELDVSALPVGGPGNLVGIVTDRDLLYRVLAEGRHPERTSVGEVATRLVFTCRAGDELTLAMDLMASHNIRRLPVVDEGSRTVIGWLTLSDLSRHLLVESSVVQEALTALTERLAPMAEWPATTDQPDER